MNDNELRTENTALRDALREAIAAYMQARRHANAPPNEPALARWRAALRGAENANIPYRNELNAVAQSAVDKLRANALVTALEKLGGKLELLNSDQDRLVSMMVVGQPFEGGFRFELRRRGEPI